MTRTRRGQTPAQQPPPKCDHCDSVGHISTICPRTNYLPQLPAASCTHCIRTVRSGWADEPDAHQIILTLDPCYAHSSPVVRPSRHPPSPPPPYSSVVSTRPHPPAPPTVVTIPTNLAGTSSTTSSSSTPDPVVSTTATTSPTAPNSQPGPTTALTSDSLAAAPSSTGPIRRSRVRTFSLSAITGSYEEVLRKVNSGSSLTDALAQSGVSRTHFNRKRPIAEASKVDMPRLQQAIQQVIKPTVENIFPQARTICNQNLPALRTLHARGEVVAPKENY